MLNLNSRTAYRPDHDSFRDTVRKFAGKHVYPNLDRWEAEKIVDRALWLEAGKAGLLCPTVPQAEGGLGLDYGFNCVITEEMAYAGASLGIGLQSDITVGYLLHYGSSEQKSRWLPGMISGEVITAIAMTEPGTGSDLKNIQTVARRDGNHYVISGSKTYISNGQTADLVITVAKTDNYDGSKGISLILVETTTEGFRRGRNLDKIGQNAADTSELFFDDVRVPITNCLGAENRGFIYLMSQLPQERLSIAVAAQAGAQRAFDEAVNFTRQRTAFNQKIFDFQNTKFTLGDLASSLQVGWAHLDWAIKRHIAGELTAAEGAAAKLWHSELQWRVVDAALQLHGGAGYMNDYPIARLWRDARVQRIYGGTSEIMKEVVARSIQ